MAALCHLCWGGPLSLYHIRHYSGSHRRGSGQGIFLSLQSFFWILGRFFGRHCKSHAARADRAWLRPGFPDAPLEYRRGRTILCGSLYGSRGRHGATGRPGYHSPLDDRLADGSARYAWRRAVRPDRRYPESQAEYKRDHHYFDAQLHRGFVE